MAAFVGFATRQDDHCPSCHLVQVVVEPGLAAAHSARASPTVDPEDHPRRLVDTLEDAHLAVMVPRLESADRSLAVP